MTYVSKPVNPNLKKKKIYIYIYIYEKTKEMTNFFSNFFNFS